MMCSSVAEVIVLTEAIRTATEPVSPWMRGRLSTDALDDAQRSATGYGQAVGLRVSDESFMGEDSAGLLGHTGFTGTSMESGMAQEARGEIGRAHVCTPVTWPSRVP